MELPKSTLSRLLLVVNNSRITETEKTLVQLLTANKAEEAIKLLQEQIQQRTKSAA